MESRSGPPGAVGEQLREVSDGLGKLVREHVELARSELETSVKRAARDLGATAVGVGLLAVGYLLLAFAVAFGLGLSIGLARGFLVVSAAHVVVGVALGAVFARRLRGPDKPQLPVTTRELARDKVFLGRVGHIVRDEPQER